MRSTPGHHHTSTRAQSLASESTATPHRVPPPLGSAPPSPGVHSAAQAPVSLESSSPRSPLHFAPPPVSFGSPEWPEAKLRCARRLALFLRHRGSTVHRPTSPGPPCVDSAHGINRWKIICYSDYSEILQRGSWTFMKSTRGPDFANFALRPLGFSEINPRSTIFAVRSKIQKYLQKGPSPQKNPQK
jgi:hypothetical protein